MTTLLTGSWAKDARNSRFLPSVGSLTRVSGEIAVPGGDLTYYKLFAQHQRFFPLARDFVLVLDAEVGYGDGFGDTDRLPLTDNFFAGGLRSVRGFRANTLGPRDSLDEPLGGNLKVVGTAEVILPLPFTKDSTTTRVTGFFDIGNVYDTEKDFEPLRYSTGLALVWFSPVGPFTMSLARPLKTLEGDETQSFQFTIGTSF